MSKYFASWREGLEVVWRNLTWAEYKTFKDNYEQSPFEEPMEVALGIYATVYLQGPDPKYVPAGIAAYICKQQMISNPYSGRYEDIAPALELARRVVTGDYLLSAKALISSTFNYKLEEIDSWDPNKFFLRLAQTEVVTGRSFEPMDPKAPKDASGNPIQQKKKHKPLTLAQQNALDRTREARAKG